jgi:hypothetical protein
MRAREEHDARLGRGREDVDDGAGRAPGADRVEQRQHALEGVNRAPDVGATFETDRGLRLETQALARAPHDARVEIRALNCHARRRRRDFGRASAHHTRDGDRVVAIGNHEHRRRERPGLAVEGRESFAGPGQPRAERRPGKLGRIERVHRLAQLEHHVVGDVDDGVDRAHAGGGEAIGQPGRRGRHGDVGGRESVTAAERAVEAHRHRAGVPRRRAATGISWVSSRRAGHRRAGAEGRPRLARQADHAHRVRPVGRDLEVDRVAVDRFDCEAACGQARRDDRGIGGHVREFAEPRDDESHRSSCSRKRRSFS